MKLAVFLNLRFYEYNGKYSADEQYYKFWILLAEKVSHITLCVPTEMNKRQGRHPVAFNRDRVSICPLPMYKNSWDLYLKFPYFAFLSAKRCASVIRESQLFIAVIPNILGIWLSIFARKNKTPCAYYIRGNLEKTVKYEYRNSIMAFLPATLFRFIDRLSKHEMKKHLSFVVGAELHYKYLSNGIRTVPIITSFVRECDVVEFLPRKNLGKEITLLTVGRLSTERGIETLLEALSILNSKYPYRLTCKIVGDGPQRQYLEKKTRELLLNNVLFTGYISYGPEMIAEYRKADAFVLPSYTEGFPKVIIEAMANAIPIVSTCVGGIPFVLKSGYDSILVPPRNPEALAEGIAKLLKDIILYNRIGVNAFNTIQKLTYEKQSEIFLRNVYDYVRSTSVFK